MSLAKAALLSVHVLSMVILMLNKFAGCVSDTENRHQMASIGDVVHFKCNVSDPLQIEWDKDGFQLIAHSFSINKTLRAENFTSYRISLNHDYSELNITNILQDDAGVYNCNVTTKRSDDWTIKWHLTITDYTKENHLSWFLPSIIAAAVAVVLSGIICSVYLYKKCKQVHEAPDHIEGSGQPTGPDPIYQSLRPATMDQDQVYSVITPSTAVV